MQKKTLFLLDAVNFLFRSYYAIAPMTNHKGESTHALFGFIRSVSKLLSDLSPDYFVAVFDGPDNKKTRTDLYADYKNHRKSMPEDLASQLEGALTFCKLAGIPVLQIPGVEADDTLGTIVRWVEELPITSYICTSDKDMCQLVSDNTFVIHAHKNNRVIDASGVKELFGVRPDQIVDYLALIGDASDNIPGVKGIGPKTAVSLLEEFGSLTHLLEKADTLTGKKKEQILQEKEKALLSYKLASLQYDVPIPRDLSFYTISPPSSEELQAFYQENHFLSLMKENPKANTQVTIDYQLVNTEKELALLLSLLQKQHSICVDTKACQLKPMEAQLIGIGLGFKPGQAWYIPVNGDLSPSIVKQFLSILFTTEGISFYGHNIKYALHVLSNENIPLPKVDFDTILASYLLTPHILQHSLDALTWEKFSHKKIAIEELIGKGKSQISIQQVPLAQVCRYCCEEIDYTIRLKEFFLKELKEKNLLSLLENMEIPLISILFKMERHGIFLDLPAIRKVASSLSLKISSLEKEIYALAGETFNLNSPKQLSVILFEKLGLKPPQKIQTGFSTGAEVLEILAEASPIIPLIQAYRLLEKLRSTYADSLQEEVNPITHRIHCTFNQSVAATGRLSCQNPNLQNIPIRSEEGKKIRSAFRPELSGWSFVSADYSQIELRLLAHLSEDPALIQAFTSGEDVHTYTASLLFSVPINEVTPQMRHQAKTVNFGILYGQQAFGLSKELGISFKEAESFIATYFSRYTKVKEFIDSCKETARNKGFSLTITGRKRPILEINNKNPILRSQAERLAINTPLQGTSADLIKLAMINIEKEWPPHLRSFLFLQIHDELLFECPDEEISPVSAYIKKQMESVFFLKIPLIVDISIGKNWGDC